MANILIMDEEESAAQALRTALANEGHQAHIAHDWQSGLGLASEATAGFHVVIADLYWRTPDNKRREPKGLNLMDELRSNRAQLPVILMTSAPETDTMIEASKRGAYDFVTKPKLRHVSKTRSINERELDDLLDAVSRAVGSQLATPTEQEPANPAPARDTTLPSTRSLILGRSRVMQKVYIEIGRAAARPVTVLVRGETGTGKELVARALHEHSERSKGPFIIVNCVAIPESLLESELFGHEKSAFTGASAQRLGRFEQANHGTIFLDEIGDMCLATQAKLLRVLQEKTVRRVGGDESFEIDVRVIAATHRDLEQALQNRQFRRDLYYRLNDVVIRLPPLRERAEDIGELAHYFVQQHAAQLGAMDEEIHPERPNEPKPGLTPRRYPTFDPEALGCLQQQLWPGNVRELKNVVRKALLLTRGSRIDLTTVQQALDQTFVRPRQKHAGPTPSVAHQPLAAYVTELLDSAERGHRSDVAAALIAWAEHEIYAQAIQLSGGDQTKAAKWLGVSRPTIGEKLSRYKLRAEQEDKRSSSKELT